MDRTKQIDSRYVRLGFTSDYHLYHKNIIKYSDRPFSDVMGMNETIRDEHNKIFEKGDIIYNLGDAVLRYKDTSDETLRSFLKTFNGNIRYLPGNHEKDWNLITSVWSGRPAMDELNVLSDDEPQHIVLCHYSLRIWNRAHHGSWHLYGHSHGGLRDDYGGSMQTNARGLSTDVGVDCNNFKPFLYDDIKKIMASRKFVASDHHTGKPEKAL